MIIIYQYDWINGCMSMRVNINFQIYKDWLS